MKTLLALALLALPAAADTFCNPIDLDYRYNFEQLNEGISYRSGADPVIINHQGEYYLFVTISGGWWHSKDLLHWDFVTPDKWPMEDMCAPAAWSDNGTLYLFQSTFGQRPIFKVADPKQGHLEFYNRWLPLMKGAEGPWDPALFKDPKSDRWFMYFGSSNTYPLYGIELDPKRNLTYQSAPVPMFKLDPKNHGWERFGQDHTDPRDPFMEGAWMTYHGGKYYLQYGAPDTEHNVYANATYVGDTPLGPFQYAPYNPVSYKPGGFAVGAGHGNTFQDNWGNYWNTGTCWIGHNWDFERRIVMYPAGFDPDGQMFSLTRFGDFPHRLPTKERELHDDLFTGWMLLSYHKPTTASSQQEGHGPELAADEQIKTFWLAGQNKPGEWLTVDLGQSCTVKAVQVNYADYKSGLFDPLAPTIYTTFKLWGSQDGQNWTLLKDLTGEPHRDRPNAYVEVTPTPCRFVKYEHDHVGAANLAVADLRVFGNAPGAPPSVPAGVRARREPDARNAIVTWEPVSGAVGYNVRWGVAPDKLYQTYQVWAEKGTRLELRALNLGQGYSVAVEAFNETGVSPLSPSTGIP